jgi:AraC-like DNA-binding protein
MPLKTLNTLLRVVVDQGYPLDRALQQIGLEFNPLESSRNDAPGEIPTATYSKLYRLLMELLQDEAFGLGQEYHAPPGTFRMMCLFVIHCATLEQALYRAWEFHDYCDQFRNIERDGSSRPFRDLPDQDLVLCLFQRSPSAGHDRHFIGHANVLLMMYRFYSWLIDRDLPLQEVHLRASKPDNDSHYQKLFGCPVRFNMEDSGLVLNRNLLQHPVAQTEESLKEFLRQAPYHLVKKDQPGKLRPLSRQIEQLLTSYNNQRLPTASEIASELNMSPRTLHRKLTAEGTSFQQLKDDFRRDLAVHYMNRPELSIDAIAAVMGFQDNSAFYRSFKKWTGISPGQFRQQLTAAPRQKPDHA